MSQPADLRGLRWPLVGVVFVLLAIVLPLLGYPLAILPREWAAQRFDFYFPWPVLAVTLLLLGVAFRRTEKPPSAHEPPRGSEAMPQSKTPPPLSEGQSPARQRFGLRQPSAALALQGDRPGPGLDSCSTTDAESTRNIDGFVLAPLAVLVSQLVSALASGPAAGQLDALFRTATGVFLCLAAARFLGPRGLKPMAIAWALAAAVEAAVMLLQAVSHAEPVGMAGNRNFAACFLAMSLPIGVACAMTMRGCGRSLARWVAASYAILLLAAMMVSESRGAAIALLIVTAGGWLARRRGVRWLAAGAGVVVAAGAAFLPPVRASAEHLWNTDVRPMIWLGSARAVADAPWTGQGPGSFARVYPAHRPPEYFDRPKAARATDHAHNEFLETAVETGAVGVLAFLSVLAVTGLAARRAIRGGDASLRPLAVGVTMGWGVLVLQNLVDINLFMPPNDSLFWLMAGWLLGASRAGGGRAAAEQAVLVHPAARLMAAAAGAWVLVVGVAQPACANWLFREGSVARSAGDERRALDRFARVTQMDPERLEAWRQAGLAAHRLGDLDTAVAAFRRAHRLMPDYADLNGEFGSLLAMKGDYTGAATLLTRATRLFPRDPANFVKLALVRLSLKEPEAARRAFEEAKRLDPDHPLVRMAEKKFSPPSESSLRAP